MIGIMSLAMLTSLDTSTEAAVEVDRKSSRSSQSLMSLGIAILCESPEGISRGAIQHGTDAASNAERNRSTTEKSMEQWLMKTVIVRFGWLDVGHGDGWATGAAWCLALRECS